jgi:putative aldouronate transport system substrate-binding protein
MKRFTIAIVIMLVAVSANWAEGRSETAAEASGVLPLSMMSIYYTAEPPQDDNPIVARMEAYTNTDFTFEWVPRSVMPEKVSTSIAAGSLSDILCVPNRARNDLLYNSVANGVFWNITDMIEDYPNLTTRISETVKYNMSFMGEIFSMPRPIPIAQSAWIYRKDWLESLDMEVPTNAEEFYQLLKAFTEDDPDGNNKDDTIGLATMRGNRAFGYLKAWFGVPNQWGEVNGRLVPDFMTDGYMEALKYMRKLYSEGLVNQDYPVLTRVQQDALLNEGKAGVLRAWTAHLFNGFFGALEKNFPNAEIDFFYRIEDEGGTFHDYIDSGYNLAYFFPTSTVDEAKLKGILEYYNAMLDDEMIKLFAVGIEGTHHTESNGTYDIDMDLIAQDLIPVEHLSPYDVITERYRYDPAPLSQKSFARAQLADLVADPNVQVHGNPTSPMVPESGLLVDNNIINDAREQFILGEIDEAGWQSAVELWLDADGQALIDSYNEQYRELQ